MKQDYVETVSAFCGLVLSMRNGQRRSVSGVTRTTTNFGSLMNVCSDPHRVRFTPPLIKTRYATEVDKQKPSVH